MYEIKANEQFNSNEVYFDGMPSEATRTALKALKMRWHGIKKCWYGYASSEAITAAINGETVTQTASEPKPKKKTAPVNQYGVKVGDLFASSWGYEQTNVNFYQVVELVGEQSVRIKEVCPRIIATDAISAMSEDITAAVPTNGEMLPVVSSSYSIKDNNGKGDLKRITKFGGINISSCEYATKYTGEKLYQSWYY